MARSLPMLLVVLGVVGGCSTSTGASDASACATPATLECYHAPDGLCGDSLAPAVCTDGAWSCPGGTIRGSACRCFIGFNGNDASGACTCGASGWVCPGPVVRSP